MTLQGIDSLAQKATNKVGESKLIHSVADIARGKTLAGATILGEVAKSELNRLTQDQPTVNKKKRKAASSHSKTAKKRKTTPTKTTKKLSQLIAEIE